MAMKGWSAFPKAPASLEPQHQIEYFWCTLIVVERVMKNQLKVSSVKYFHNYFYERGKSHCLCITFLSNDFEDFCTELIKKSQKLVLLPIKPTLFSSISRGTAFSPQLLQLLFTSFFFFCFVFFLCFFFFFVLFLFYFCFKFSFIYFVLWSLYTLLSSLLLNKLFFSYLLISNYGCRFNRPGITTDLWRAKRLLRISYCFRCCSLCQLVDGFLLGLRWVILFCFSLL